MDEMSLARASTGDWYSTHVFTLPESVSTSRIRAVSYQCHSFEGSLIRALRCLPPKTYNFPMRSLSPGLSMRVRRPQPRRAPNTLLIARIRALPRDIIAIDCDEKMNFAVRAL